MRRCISASSRPVSTRSNPAALPRTPWRKTAARTAAPAPWRRARHEARREPAARDVALAAAARRVLDREAGAAQAVANGAGGAPRRDRRLGRGQPRHRLEEARVPHRRIARRREAVEEEGIDVGDQLRQPVVDGTEREQQFDAAALDDDAVQVAGERGPLARQLGRQRRAVVVDDDPRRNDRRRLHLCTGAGAARDASHASRRSRTPSSRRYSSTAGDMLAIASCSLCAASALVTARARGTLSTWIVKIAWPMPTIGMKVCRSLRKKA